MGPASKSWGSRIPCARSCRPQQQALWMYALRDPVLRLHPTCPSCLNSYSATQDPEYSWIPHDPSSQHTRCALSVLSGHVHRWHGSMLRGTGPQLLLGQDVHSSVLTGTTGPTTCYLGPWRWSLWSVGQDGRSSCRASFFRCLES
jgi:hypothetical protein